MTLQIRTLLLTASASLLAACGDEPLKKDASGADLFAHYCETCHGSQGNGKFLEGIPANATTRLSRQEITSLILHGRADKPAMPSFGTQLDVTQARKIADHLLYTLKK